MNTTPEGLKKCAEIAYPEYEWVIENGIICVKPKHSGKINTFEEFCDSAQKTFSLDSAADVLALIEGLASKDTGAVPSRYNNEIAWYYVRQYTLLGAVSSQKSYNTLTDCLYAAAKEVLGEN